MADYDKAPFILESLQHTPELRKKTFAHWEWSDENPPTLRPIAARMASVIEKLQGAGVAEPLVNELQSLRQSLLWWDFERNATDLEKMANGASPLPAGEQLLAAGKMLRGEK